MNAQTQPNTIQYETEMREQRWLRDFYGKQTFLEICDARERLAVKPDEIYQLGSDPRRERELSVLTELMVEKSAALTRLILEGTTQQLSA